MAERAETVEAYLASLPEERREAISAVRKVILKNLPKGYQEGMAQGMIGYSIPLSVYPAGYHANPKQPVPFACLGSQKSHMALYLMPLYGHEGLAAWFREAWAKSGKKKLDMGKACIRFKKLEDVPLDVIGEAVAKVPVRKYLETYESAVKR